MWVGSRHSHPVVDWRSLPLQDKTNSYVTKAAAVVVPLVYHNRGTSTLSYSVFQRFACSVFQPSFVLNALYFRHPLQCISVFCMQCISVIRCRTSFCCMQICRPRAGVRYSTMTNFTSIDQTQLHFYLWQSTLQDIWRLQSSIISVYSPWNIFSDKWISKGIGSISFPSRCLFSQS